MPTAAWESLIVKCNLCRTPGCRYRTVANSQYCCQGCSGKTVTPGGSVPTARGVIPDQDKFHAEREPPNTAVSSADSIADSLLSALDDALSTGSRQHDAGCAMLDIDVLQGSWWEEFPCDNASEVFGLAQVNASCLVIPPANEAAWAPAPVILFLGGDGHVDDKQDFLWGGVDLLVRNPKLRERCFLVALKPTSSCGLLRCNDQWKRTWAEDAVWACFTEVLRRLGPSRVDSSRIYATGLSLGAIGVWNLATRYGGYFAAIAPVAGACEWPGGCWPNGSVLDASVLARLKDLPVCAYQIDVDVNSGKQLEDMEWMCRDLEVAERDVILPGMEKDKTCNVHVHEWHRKCGGASWELWTAKGPLNDWSAWDEWGGDKHFLWQRVYPLPEWGLADFFLRHSVPECRRWRFDSPPAFVDIRCKILECMITATKNIAAGMAKPWQEQVQEFVQAFFDALCCACGDRPWLDKGDFTPTVLYGVRAHLVHLLPYTISPEFDVVVRKATHLCLDKVRYNLRSFPIIRSVVSGKRWQVHVREAVDRAREEVAAEMHEMDVDEFIKVWIAKAKEKLEKEGSLRMLPRMSALKLFRDMVTEGGGIPAPLMPQMQGVVVSDWIPLTRTVNRLFDDPDPPREKKPQKDWSKEWSDSKSTKDWGSGSKSTNEWGSGDTWANHNAVEQMMMALGGGGGWGSAKSSSWNSTGRNWGKSGPY